MEIDDGWVNRLGMALSKLEDRLDGLPPQKPSNSHASTTNAATISVNAGGVGVWIAVICCAVMLGGLVGIGFWFNAEMAHIAEMRNEQNRRMDKLERDVRDMNDYLAAIYVQAPQLKPKEKTQ